MINSFKNPAIMRILRTTERYEAGWREQNFIPDNEAGEVTLTKRCKGARRSARPFRSAKNSWNCGGNPSGLKRN